MFDSLHIALESLKTDLILTIPDYIGITLTIINVIIAILMFVVTKKSHDLAEKAFSTSQRPFMNIIYEGNFRTAIEADYLKFAISIENIGTVPAKHIHSIVKIFLDKEEIPITLTPSLSAVFPNNRLQIYEGDIREKAFEKLKKGALFTILSEIKYEGLKTKGHSTKETCQYKIGMKTINLVAADCI